MKFVAAPALVLAALATAQTPAVRPEFEVASVKPNTAGSGMTIIRPPEGGRFTATNASLKMLVGLAYKVQNYAISGGPAWINSDHYDITAKAVDSILTLDQLRPMLQALLEDRFRLKVHLENKDVPVYALLPAKGGPKLPQVKENGCFVMDGKNPLPPPPPPPPGGGPGAFMPGKPPCGGMMIMPNRMQGGKISMTQFVNTLSSVLGRPVIDKTGFTGVFDLHLEFTPEGTAFPGAHLPPDAPAFDTSGPSIFTAAQEQLGLKLESQKAPGEILVIDAAEKATEN